MIRRSQRDRREQTIGRLIAATIEALLEVGYAGTTVSEICRRSGVSHGGLFRHFASLHELVIAAGEEVAAAQIADFEERFARAPDRTRPVAAALGLLREACRAPRNAVFYELLIAGRTDAELRRALGPALRRYYDAILGAARAVPGIERLPAELLEPLVFGLTHLFDGEAMIRTVLPRPEVEDRRLALLGQAVEALVTA